MSDDIEASQTGASEVARWHRQGDRSHSRRTRCLAITSCLLASLIGTLLAVASLPARRNETVLVSLYLSPLSESAAGVDAPHPPEADRLFGLTAKNLPIESADEKQRLDALIAKKSDSDLVHGQQTKNATSHSSNDDASSNQTESRPSDEASPPAAENSKSSQQGDIARSSVDRGRTGLNWRQSLQSVSSREQLVLHVSSIASFEHDEVFFVGCDRNQTEQHVSLSNVLTELKECPARSKLLVLEIHWPTLTDSESANNRTAILNDAVQSKVASMDLNGVHVLLSASGDGCSRGLTDRPRSLLSYFFRERLEDLSPIWIGTEGLPWKKLFNGQGPRIVAASSKRGPAQQVLWLPSEDDFAFDRTVSAKAESDHALSNQRDYPEAFGFGLARA